MKKPKKTSPEGNPNEKQTSSDEQLGKLPKSPIMPTAELSRRKFLTYAAGTGVLAGIPDNLLASDYWHRKRRHGKRHKRNMELRTYVFNLSHMDTSFHDLIMVAGKRRVPLVEVTRRHLSRLRRRHPILRVVPDEHLTHIITLRMPANDVQLCYIRRTSRFATGTSWDMAMMFHHHPMRALHHAARRRRRIIADAEGPWLPTGVRNREIHDFGHRKFWRYADARW
ncbi:MAG: hypothetical protein GY794_25975, partial [bacterium]|nr:hypothetical protein [bacterium]